MMISFIMVALLVAGVLACITEKRWLGSAKWVALIALILLAALFGIFIVGHELSFETLQVLTRVTWIQTFNIEYSIALDQLSIVLISLTWFLAVICVLVSWREISDKAGFYYFNLLASIAGIIGVFVAVDMFLFFFFWEIMLLPMTAIIAIWGHENRHFAAIKFFIFTSDNPSPYDKQKVSSSLPKCFLTLLILPPVIVSNPVFTRVTRQSVLST